MKAFIKYGILYVSLFAVAAGGSFAIQYKPTKSNDNEKVDVTDTPMSAGEKLISSVMGYEAMDITANINMVTSDNTKFAFDFNGKGSIQDLNDIKIGGQLDLNLDGTELDADFSFFGDKLAFHVLDNYFKLEKADLLDFIGMIPNYGIQLKLPEGLDNLDINTITSEITSISDEDRKELPAGGYYYTINIGDLEVKVKADENDNLKGLIIDPFFYEGMKFSLEADLEETKIANVNTLNQLNGPDADKFQNFQPVFNLIDVASKFTQSEKMGINLGLVLDETKNGETSNFLATDIDLNFDRENAVFSLDGSIFENERTHKFLAAYQDQTIYANYHNLFISLETASISDIATLVINGIGEQKVVDVLNELVSSAGDLDIGSLSEKIINTIGYIGVDNERISLNLDLSTFSEELKPIDVVVTFDNQTLKTLEIKDLEIKNFSADLVVTFQDYVAPIVQKERYVAIEPVEGLIPYIFDLVDDTQFRLEFDAIVDKEDANERDVTINGGLQFDIENNFGYGEMNIVDSDNYLHNIKADMKNKDEFLFSYNNKLNGKFSSKTLEDLLVLVKDIVADPDEHFMELFGDLLIGDTALLIQSVLDGKYGVLLEYNIIDNLQITNTYISFDVSLELLKMDKKFNIKINYTPDYENDFSVLESLEISGIELDGASISATIRLEKFNDSLESSRLDPSKSYMDFSDIKVLLELGVNTSEFNYYHFSAEASLSLGSWTIEKFPIDIKIRNEKGHVKVDAYFSDLPVIAIVTPNDKYYSASDRSAHIYYEGENIYIQRNERVREKLLSLTKKDYQLTRRCSIDFFLDNILEVMLQDVLSIGDTIMNLINKSDNTQGEKEQIHYEELINDFLYNEKDGYFFADINLAEIAHNKMFSLLTAKIYEDKENHILKGIDAHLTINLTLIKINIDLSLNFLNDRSVAIWEYDEQGNVIGDKAGTSLATLDAFVAVHQNDALNERIVTLK